MIEQTKTKPQETPELKLFRQTQTFTFNPPNNFSEEGKMFLAVTFSAATNSIFTITDENKSFQFQHQVVGTPMMVKNLLTS